MHTSIRRGISAAFVLLASFATMLFVAAPPAPARTQSAGNAGTISGAVVDPTGAFIANATVTLANAISGFSRTVTTDNSGAYTITNIPFNTYRLTITAPTWLPSTPDRRRAVLRAGHGQRTLQVASESTG
jgi:hypothetical protein